VARISIKIDNKPYNSEEGKTILEVAEKNGIHIPTLCYHEKITHNTSCFVCVVKDVKTGRFIPSCSSLITENMEIESESEEVFSMRQTALNLLLSEHTGDCEAPCTIACPAHAKVEEYVRAGRKGQHLEALKIIKERIPLPMSIGRVCPRFCEKDCRRNVMDRAVAINDFKRLAADLFYESYMEELPELSGRKVGIVGAGPAGLAIAYYLRLEGIASDLYERMPQPGGMLRYGIPEYRLPKAIVDKEIAHFAKMGGIEIHCNRALGENLSLDELKANYDAIAITIGSWQTTPMRGEGEELTIGGINWLETIARNNWNGVNPGKTIVIGGGNTAMDCVRTAVRLGSAEVFCFYRRTEKEMPAEQIEIDEAREEGVRFQFLTAPVKLKEENGKKILTCIQMELGEPDASGRRRPIPIAGSEFDVEADTIIAAIGQKTIVPKDLLHNRWGNIEVNQDNNQMAENIFSAGDCITGPATVVEAVAGGRRAALGIIAHLNNEAYKEPYTINVSRGHWQSLRPDDLVLLRDINRDDRQKQHLIPLAERKTTFKEVTKTFTEEEIAREGERCLECSCTAKSDCKLKDLSELYSAHPEAIIGEKLHHNYDTRHPEIILDRNKCIKCGICVKICKDVVNKSLLGFKDRGYGTYLDTAFNQALPLYCKDCGECIEACPVGALDWKNKN
jgi:formate dehydrogenase major subunit